MEQAADSASCGSILSAIHTNCNCNDSVAQHISVTLTQIQLSFMARQFNETKQPKKNWPWVPLHPAGSWPARQRQIPLKLVLFINTLNPWTRHPVRISPLNGSNAPPLVTNDNRLEQIMQSQDQKNESQAWQIETLSCAQAKHFSCALTLMATISLDLQTLEQTICQRSSAHTSINLDRHARAHAHSGCSSLPQTETLNPDWQTAHAQTTTNEVASTNGKSRWHK